MTNLDAGRAGPNYDPLRALPAGVRAVVEPHLLDITDVLLLAGDTSPDPDRFTRAHARLHAGSSLARGCLLRSGDQIGQEWHGTVNYAVDGGVKGQLRWRKVIGPYDPWRRGTPVEEIAPDVAWVAVAAGYRRRGIATALLAHACLEAGAVLASTVRTDDGAGWGPEARDRVRATAAHAADGAVYLAALHATTRFDAPWGTVDAARARLADDLALALADHDAFRSPSADAACEAPRDTSA